MRELYFIAHVLDDKNSESFGHLAETIARSFRVTSVLDKCPPHVTVVPPFEVHDIPNFKNLEERIEEIVGSFNQFQYAIDGFGNFGHHIVYARAFWPPKSLSLINRLVDEVRDFPSIVFDGARKEVKPHVTLAKRLLTRQARVIKSFLARKIFPRRVVLVDKLSLLHFKEGRWHVVRDFTLAQ